LVLQKLGYSLYGTPGTASYYEDLHQVKIQSVNKPLSEADDAEGTALFEIKGGKIDLVINISEDATRREEVTSGYIIRRAAVDFGISLITNIKCAIELAECLDRGLDKRFVPRHIGEFYKLPTIGWTNK
jgi:carbamoyl-phosphate synthase/aspartate carbamoyltransferase